MRMRTDLLDGHVYILKKWVLQFLVDNKSISSIKNELIPTLTKKQFAKPQRDHKFEKSKASTVSIDVKPDVGAYGEVNELEKMAFDMSTSGNIHSWTDRLNQIRCCTYIIDDPAIFCARANNFTSYAEINRQIYKHLSILIRDKDSTDKTVAPIISGKSQIGGDCLIDNHVRIGDKVSIKRSIIGAHCMIADRVKLTNCVIMDGVSIEEGCIITGSILASGAQIGEKSEIKDSIIGAKRSTMALSKLTNEAITSTDQLMEI